MRIKSGIAEIGKREVEAVITVMKHCKTDLSYGGGGTFTDGSPDDNPDMKEITKARRGLEIIAILIDFYQK